MGRCNTGLEFTSGSFKAQNFSWALIQLQSYFVEISLRIVGCAVTWPEPVLRKAVAIRGAMATTFCNTKCFC